MSVVYAAATKTSRMTAVLGDIGASGKLKLWDAAGTTLLASFTLAATAGVVAGAVLTLSDGNGGLAGILNTTALAVGTAVKASITTAAGSDVVTNALTVGLTGSGADVILDIVAFTAIGQAITITSGTLTHA